MKKTRKEPWLAVLLSFLVTGMGQIYNKEYTKGILLFIAYELLFISNIFYRMYWLFLIQIPIWIYSIGDAWKTAKKTINEEPYKHAIRITVIIYIILAIAILLLPIALYLVIRFAPGNWLP